MLDPSGIFDTDTLDEAVDVSRSSRRVVLCEILGVPYRLLGSGSHRGVFTRRVLFSMENWAYFENITTLARAPRHVPKI